MNSRTMQSQGIYEPYPLESNGVTCVELWRRLVRPSSTQRINFKESTLRLLTVSNPQLAIHSNVLCIEERLHADGHVAVWLVWV